MPPAAAAAATRPAASCTSGVAAPVRRQGRVVAGLAVIAPSETRLQIVRGLRALRDKRSANPAKKHGNIPL